MIVIKNMKRDILAILIMVAVVAAAFVMTEKPTLVKKDKGVQTESVEEVEIADYSSGATSYEECVELRGEVYGDYPKRCDLGEFDFFFFTREKTPPINESYLEKLNQDGGVQMNGFNLECFAPVGVEEFADFLVNRDPEEEPKLGGDLVANLAQSGVDGLSNSDRDFFGRLYQKAFRVSSDCEYLGETEVAPGIFARVKSVDGDSIIYEYEDFEIYFYEGEELLDIEPYRFISYVAYWETYMNIKYYGPDDVFFFYYTNDESGIEYHKHFDGNKWYDYRLEELPEYSQNLEEVESYYFGGELPVFAVHNLTKDTVGFIGRTGFIGGDVFSDIRNIAVNRVDGDYEFVFDRNTKELVEVKRPYLEYLQKNRIGLEEAQLFLAWASGVNQDDMASEFATWQQSGVSVVGRSVFHPEGWFVTEITSDDGQSVGAILDKGEMEIFVVPMLPAGPRDTLATRSSKSFMEFRSHNPCKWYGFSGNYHFGQSFVYGEHSGDVATCVNDGLFEELKTAHILSEFWN